MPKIYCYCTRKRLDKFFFNALTGSLFINFILTTWRWGHWSLSHINQSFSPPQFLLNIHHFICSRLFPDHGSKKNVPNPREEFVECFFVMQCESVWAADVERSFWRQAKKREAEWDWEVGKTEHFSRDDILGSVEAQGTAGALLLLFFTAAVSLPPPFSFPRSLPPPNSFQTQSLPLLLPPLKTAVLLMIIWGICWCHYE